MTGIFEVMFRCFFCRKEPHHIPKSSSEFSSRNIDEYFQKEYQFTLETLPPQLTSLIVHIAREGVCQVNLFRISGNIREKARIMQLLTAPSSMSTEPIVWSSYKNFHTLASVVKECLISFRGGLLGREVEDALLDALNEEDDQTRVDRMRPVLAGLDPRLQRLFALLCGTWFRMIYHISVNNMTIQAVARSVAGSVFQRASSNIEKAYKSTKVMEFLISSFAQPDLFGAELINYFTQMTNTSINLKEKLRYEFIIPRNFPKMKAYRHFICMLQDEAKKHNFDLERDAVTQEVFEATTQQLPMISRISAVDEEENHRETEMFGGEGEAQVELRKLARITSFKSNQQQQNKRSAEQLEIAQNEEEINAEDDGSKKEKEELDKHGEKVNLDGSGFVNVAQTTEKHMSVRNSTPPDTETEVAVEVDSDCAILAESASQMKQKGEERRALLESGSSSIEWETREHTLSRVTQSSHNNQTENDAIRTGNNAASNDAVLDVEQNDKLGENEEKIGDEEEQRTKRIAAKIEVRQKSESLTRDWNEYLLRNFQCGQQQQQREKYHQKGGSSRLNPAQQRQLKWMNLRSEWFISGSDGHKWRCSGGGEPHPPSSAASRKNSAIGVRDDVISEDSRIDATPPHLPQSDARLAERMERNATMIASSSSANTGDVMSSSGNSVGNITVASSSVATPHQLHPDIDQYDVIVQYFVVTHRYEPKPAPSPLQSDSPTHSS